MEIEVVTSSKGKRELIESVASLFAQALNIEKSKYKLTIGTVSGLAKADKINGSVCLVGPKYLLMFLDSRLPISQLFITLAHEMVHVKQYAKGQLKVRTTKRGNHIFTWLGKKYNLDYYDLPWELEAFSKERILANKVAQILSV
jgi:hypothetical protein